MGTPAFRERLRSEGFHKSLLPKRNAEQIREVHADQKPCSYLLEQLVQFVLQLKKVSRRDETLVRFIQTVPSQLNDLMVSETKYPICQGENMVWRVAGDDLLQTLFHLSCGLWEPFFVDMVHHNYFMVTAGGGPSRAETPGTWTHGCVSAPVLSGDTFCCAEVFG